MVLQLFKSIGNVLAEEPLSNSSNDNNHEASTMDAFDISSAKGNKITENKINPTIQDTSENKEQIQGESRKFNADFENAFDDLRERHETLCRLVEATGSCIYHYIPIVYFACVVSLCFLIFSLTTTPIRSEDTYYSFGILMFSATGVTVLTVFGCMVNESVSMSDYLQCIHNPGRNTILFDVCFFLQNMQTLLCYYLHFVICSCTPTWLDKKIILN